MLAYHNNPATKAKYIARMKYHMEADSIVQGLGWDGHRGCAVGCTFQGYDHARGPIEIGVPEPLMRLEDAIFEGLFWDEAREFPLAFLESIPVGADLSMVWPRIGLWMLSDPHHGVLHHCDDATRPAVESVIGLYRRWVGGKKPTAEEFDEASWAAAEAFGAAAWAAEEAAEAAGAAWAARAAARAAAEAAGAAEAAAAARAAAEEGFWLAARNELLRLLREAPVAAQA